MHILPIVTVSFTAGIVFELPWPYLLVLALLSLPRRLRASRIPVLAFIAGSLIAVPTGPSDLKRALPGASRLVELTGTVRTGPDLPIRGRSLLTLAVDLPEEGRVRVAIPAGSPLPHPGDRISVVGRLSLPRQALNPGERDTRELLGAKGISHLLSAPSPYSLRIRKRAPWWHPGALVHLARRRAEKTLRGLPDRRARGLLTALLLGRREGVDPALVDAFRRTGTTHFLAISGLHIGILAGTLWLLLAPLPVSRRLTAPSVAMLVLLYAALTGARPPVLRASLITALIAGGVVLRRPVRPLHLLAFALLTILASAHRSVDSAGVQLSFVAVLAILTLSKKFELGLFERWILMEKFSVPREHFLPIRLGRRYLRKSLPVALAAWFATAPLILYHFGSLSILTVPANLLVLPLVSLLLPAGFLYCVSGFSGPAVVLTDLLARTVELLARIPAASFTFPAPPVVALSAWYVALLALWRRPAIGRKLLAALILGLALLAVSGLTLRRAPTEPRLTVLAVGHGLATVLETPEGGVLAYDAGSARPEIFRQVVLPFLRSRQIARVDALVLSHEDMDHSSGVPAFLRQFPVKRFYAPRIPVAGDRIPLPGASVEVLWPLPGTTLSDNDASTVLRLHAGGLSVLFTGDLEEDGFEGLLATGSNLQADVLILPHHGRPHGAAKEFVEAVRPRVLISSNGANEPLDAAWSSALRTEERGALVVTPGPKITAFRATPGRESPGTPPDPPRRPRSPRSPPEEPRPR